LTCIQYANNNVNLHYGFMLWLQLNSICIVIMHLTYHMTFHASIFIYLVCLHRHHASRSYHALHMSSFMLHHMYPFICICDLHLWYVSSHIIKSCISHVILYILHHAYIYISSWSLAYLCIAFMVWFTPCSQVACHLV
jgi:hypothetical protein